MSWLIIPWLLVLAVVIFGAGMWTQQYRTQAAAQRDAEDARIAAPLAPEAVGLTAATQVVAQPRPPSDRPYRARHSLIVGDTTTEFDRIVEHEFRTEGAT